MPFRRIAALPPLIASDALTSQLVGIGMNFAAPPAPDPNIEDTILFASIEGMEKLDLRVLTMLTTWFGIHAAWVNADRLTTLAIQSSARVRAFWSALARWQRKDRRFVRLSASYQGPRRDVLEVGTDFQLQRHGEDPRFAGSAIRVAANILRDRPADVLSPSLLARRHHVYRFRIMMGPNYRADMWAALESDATLSAAAWPEKPMVLLQPLGMFDATSGCYEYLLLGELLIQSPRKKPVASIRVRFAELSQSQAGKRSEHRVESLCLIKTSRLHRT